ncbi:MAG TPA: hypothetical protein VLD57_12295 [Blastocatellia bacterium]|nr:hypothetical protein [Blastocatellia bacterium]
MNKPKGKPGTLKSTRREFARSIAALAATPLLAGSETARATEAILQQTPPADQPSFTALSLGEIVRARYEKFLTPEQIIEIKRSIDRSLRSADRLKEFELKNADEPAFAFSPQVSRADSDPLKERDRERNRNRQ